MYDILIRGAEIYDGTGGAPFSADVAVTGGRIAAVGTHDELLRSNDIYRETYMSQNKQSHDEKMGAIDMPGDAKGEEVEQHD